MTSAHRLTSFLTLLLFSAGAFVSCSDSDHGSGYVGVGTVELNDTTFALHYYSNTLNISDATWKGSLTDGARVYFTGTGYDLRSVSDSVVCDFSPKSITEDITTDILYIGPDSVNTDSLKKIASSAEGFSGQNIHITRDWRRNDFLDAMCTYPGTNDGVGDYFGLVLDSTEYENDSLQVMWLRLCRAQTDSVQIVTHRISVPFNCMRDSTKERIYLRLKRLDSDGDTIVKDYVYSYVNWVN